MKIPGWSTWGLRPESLATLHSALMTPGISAGHATEPEARTFRDEDEIQSGGVAVLNLRGLITPQPSFISLLFGGREGGLMSFRRQLREAAGSSDVTAIVLNIDSPGGSTQLLAETAADIRDAAKAKPVVAVANTLAASAAYWLAAQADEIVVTPSGEVGSIGVVAVHWDESAFNERLGFDPTVISAGKYKAEGNPFEPLSEEAQGSIQEMVDDYYELFVADVALGRRVTADAVREGFGEGRVLTAKRAVAAGLADRIETIEETIARVADSEASGPSAAAPAPRPAAGDPAPPEPKPPAEDDLETPGNPEPNSDEVETPPDEEATARTRRSAIDVLTA